MKLKENVANDIADRCAQLIVDSIGMENLSKYPYDAINAEIAEMVEDIEDRVDHRLFSSIDESIRVQVPLEKIWD